MYHNEAMQEELKRVLTSKVADFEGQEVKLQGWVNIRRDHGKLIFFDLRDKDGLVQVIVNARVSEEAYNLAQEIRPEYVIEVIGRVNKRPEGSINKDMQSGTVEIEALSISVLNTSETPPIDVTTNGLEIGEDLRLKYRYLDLRRSRMQKNLRLRHKIVKEIRDFLDKEDFIEVETPVLTKSTPEGARDYVVPSRLEKGKFYALPQSPQQYKQLLMVAGIERYFQIARCFRDEDTRSDRQPEFTQMDLEMSFVQREDVMKINEALMIHLVKTLLPDKKIQEIPFPRISFKEVMEKYGSDRPDFRKDKNDKDLLAFVWVIDFPFFEKTENESWTFTHNPFSSPKPEFIDDLMEKKNIENILTTQYDIVLNGFEIGGGSIRNHNPQALQKVFEIMGYEEKQVLENFGHMLKALSFGAPPHGGIAWGLDRLVTLLQNEESIREVIAFAKTGEGRDLMMESPSQISDKQLQELGLKLK